ncbi:MAG: hypothetical protein LBN26_04145 [Christensenellaceae bacterium]|nr:hypothetical protein [Christensenellaceae bacterium]
MKGIIKQVLLFALIFSFLGMLVNCSKEDNRFQIYIMDDGMHLFVDDEEYIDATMTLWTSKPEATSESEFIGTTSNNRRKYKIYEFGDTPVMQVEPVHKWTDFENLPWYILYKKGLAFPELSNDTIDGVNLVVRPGFHYLRQEYNINDDTISNVLDIILNGEKINSTGRLKYTLLLSSNSIPEFASGHDIMQDGDQYFIQVLLKKNYSSEYASIPKELLEEIIGGPLSEEP